MIGGRGRLLVINSRRGCSLCPDEFFSSRQLLCSRLLVLVTFTHSHPRSQHRHTHNDRRARRTRDSQRFKHVVEASSSSSTHERTLRSRAIYARPLFSTSDKRRLQGHKTMATGGEKLRFGPACLCCAPPTAWWDPEEAAAASADGPRREAPKLLNTFTKTKVPFVPLNGNRVGWYICGPTVYGGAINRLFFFSPSERTCSFFLPPLQNSLSSLLRRHRRDATRVRVRVRRVRSFSSPLFSSLLSPPCRVFT